MSTDGPEHGKLVNQTFRRSIPGAFPHHILVFHSFVELSILPVLSIIWGLLWGVRGHAVKMTPGTLKERCLMLVPLVQIARSLFCESASLWSIYHIYRPFPVQIVQTPFNTFQELLLSCESRIDQQKHLAEMFSSTFGYQSHNFSNIRLSSKLTKFSEITDHWPDYLGCPSQISRFSCFNTSSQHWDVCNFLRNESFEIGSVSRISCPVYLPMLPGSGKWRCAFPGWPYYQPTYFFEWGAYEINLPSLFTWSKNSFTKIKLRHLIIFTS